jgi:multidrug efflux pump subunit AcrB
MLFERILRHGILVWVAALVIGVLSLLAALRIPVQMIPDLEVRTISVETRWPGATPQDVEKEILIEQEEYLRTVPGLRRMLSQASTGSASIDLEFPFGVNIDEALIRVSNALSQVSGYPENVDEPRVLASAFSSNAFMYFAVLPLPGNPRGIDIDLMLDYVDDTVRTRMERVPGVSQVGIGGGAERQVQVWVEPAKLAERGLTLSEIRGAIRSRNRDISAGDIDSGDARYLMRTVGRFDDLESLRALIIAEREGAFVRLGDVAEVRLDHSEIRGQSFSRGEPSLSLQVRRETGSNVIEIKRAMLPVMDEINRDLLNPIGMQMVLNSDDARYVEDSVANVWNNLGIGALLAGAVLFGFLRSARLTAVGVIGIPLCALAAFLGLELFGRTINVISLAGIAFALGMTLDNSIVVLENIEHKRRQGLDRFQAALQGVQEVWAALLASSLTTVLVFAPVMFIAEEAGQLYSDVAIAISAAILASLGTAITLVPLASLAVPTRSLPQHIDPAAGLGAVPVALRRILDRPLRRNALVLGVLVGTLGLAAWLTPPAEYLPEGEEAKTFSSMIAPPGTNLARMQRIGDAVQAQLVPHLDAEPDDFEAGRTPIPPLRSLVMSVSPGSLRVIAETSDPSHIDALMDAIDDLYRGYPGMRAFSSRGSIISSNDGGTRSVNLDIAGRDLAELYRVAEAAYRRAEAAFVEPRINSSPGSLVLGQPLLALKPRWERAAELGLSGPELGFAVAALSDGAFVDEYFLDDDKIDLYLYSSAVADKGLSAIAQLPIHTPRGGVLPLEAVVEIEERLDTETLRRVNGRRTVTLNIIPPRSVALETAVETVRLEVLEAMRDAGEIPAGVEIDISGASDQLDATRESLSSNFLVAVLLCYLLLVAIFNHFGYPWLILTSVPLGVAGGIIGLAILNLFVRQPFDMITMLGFLILVGTVVNNPILIVDHALREWRRGARDTAKIVADAVAARIRPMLMSTITTLAGLAPLVFIPGAGTELYRGVGAVVLFGLLFSLLVSLSFLPALLQLVLERLEVLEPRPQEQPAS